MNHPEPKDWIPYLYKEAPLEERRRLKEHLQNCAECRAELQVFECRIRSLDAWKLPRSHPLLQSAFPALKWAAAALILLGIFAAGRLSARGTDAERIRARIEPEIRQQLKTEFAQLVRQEVDRAATTTLTKANLHTDQVAADVSQALYTTFKQDVQNVRQDVATLAVNAEQRLVQLADYKQPATENH